MYARAWSLLTPTLLAKFHTLGEETSAAWLLRHAIKFNTIFSGNSTLTRTAGADAGAGLPRLLPLFAPSVKEDEKEAMCRVKDSVKSLPVCV